MVLSSCIWALSGPEEQILRKHKDLGFSTVDIRPGMLASPEGRRLVSDLGLRVSCLALSAGAPEGSTLDSPDRTRVDAALDFSRKALDHAATLGVSAAYVVPDPPVDADTPARYAESLCRIADHAAPLGIRICIEHFPGRSLPTAGGTLDFLAMAGHPNLFLLFDIGHAQMSKESTPDVIARAGKRLGYVHLDDNDGVGDLHLALTDGVQTRDDLRALFDATAKADYRGPASLEIKNTLPDPLDAIRRSRDVVKALVPIE